MSGANSPALKVFSNHLVLDRIIEHLPHIQCLTLRRLNKSTKAVVEEKLRGLKTFSAEWKYSYHCKMNKTYYGLNEVCPNLEELPGSVSSPVSIKNFPKLRHLYLDANKPALSRMIEPVWKKSHDLLSLKLWRQDSHGFDGIALIHLLFTRDFVSLKILDLEFVDTNRSLLLRGFATHFPSLEELTTVRYQREGFVEDYAEIAKLPKLKALNIGGAVMERPTEPVPSLPRLEKLTHSELYGTSLLIWNNLFAGAENLHSFVSDNGVADRHQYWWISTIPSRLEELRIRSVGKPRLKRFLASSCLRELKTLELCLHFRDVPEIMDAINRHMKNLQTFELTVCVYVEEHNQPTTFNLASLKSLCINVLASECPLPCLISTPQSKLRLFPFSFPFDPSRNLKKNLKRFEISKPTCKSYESGFIDSLVENFLRNCESLEKVVLTGWNPEEIEIISGKIKKICLPKLRGIWSKPMGLLPSQIRKRK